MLETRAEYVKIELHKSKNKENTKKLNIIFILKHSLLSSKIRFYLTIFSSVHIIIAEIISRRCRK